MAARGYEILWTSRAGPLYMYCTWETAMLALRLPPEIEARLERLASRTGRTKSFYAREAITRHIDELEDGYLALDRLERGGPRVSLDDLERALPREDAGA
jgi:RHH-type rel operon transcriptional repressor/antitoxin RelB